MKHSIWGKRAIAAFGVAALTLPALAGTATAATNVPDANTQGKITIYKYDHTKATEADKTPTGEAGQTVPAGAKAMGGIVFTGMQVCSPNTTTPLDLTKADDWKTLGANNTVAKLKAAGFKIGAANGCGTDFDFDATDATTGKTSKDVAKSAYVIHEKTAPTTVTELTPDFLVLVPMQNTEGTGWIYDVTVYPKNRTGDAAKKEIVGDTIGDVANSAKDTVNWKISATVPALKGDAKYFTSLVITDKLASAYGTAEDAKASVKVYKNGDQEANLVPAADYTVGASGDTLTVSFNKTKDGTAAAGAGTVAINAKAGDKIIVTFTTKLNAAAGSNTNTFTMVTTDDANNTTTVDPGDPGTTKINEGVFKFTKVAKDDNTSTLKGAKFKVCKAKSDLSGCADDTFVREQGATTDKIFESDADGVVTGQLLIAKGTGTVADSANFCVVEDTAPAGYKLDDAKHCFKLTTANVAGAENTVVEGGKITNEFDKGTSWVPGLPVTGAQGLVLLTLGGAALAAIAVGSAIVIRRRQH